MSIHGKRGRQNFEERTGWGNRFQRPAAWTLFTRPYDHVSEKREQVTQSPTGVLADQTGRARACRVEVP
jgi:hypothetical protein